MKTQAHKLIKILQFFTPGRTQECLRDLQNTLPFLTTCHLHVGSRI